MLRVKIEIVPFGREEDARVIEVINIGNVGKTIEAANDSKCKYEAWRNVDPRNNPDRGSPHVKVKHWRSKGAIELVRKVLAKL